MPYGLSGHVCLAPEGGPMDRGACLPIPCGRPYGSWGHVCLAPAGGWPNLSVPVNKYFDKLCVCTFKLSLSNYVQLTVQNIRSHQWYTQVWMNNTLTKIHYLHISVNNYAMPTQHQQGINWIMAPQIYLSKHKHHPTYHDTTKYTTHLGKVWFSKARQLK